MSTRLNEMNDLLELMHEEIEELPAREKERGTAKPIRLSNRKPQGDGDEKQNEKK